MKSKNTIWWIIIVIGIIIISKVDLDFFASGVRTNIITLKQMPIQKVNDCYYGKKILNIIPLDNGRYKLYLIEDINCKLALSKKSIIKRTQTITYNPNVSVGQCWNGKTIISSVPYGKNYKLTYTEGCACEFISGNNNVNDINIYITIQDGGTSNVKQYAQFLEGILKSTSPFNEYNYTFYSQQDNYALTYLNSGNWNKATLTDSCSGIVKDYSCQNKLVITLKNSGGAGFDFIEYVVIGKESINNKRTILHEIGHAFGLYHVFDDKTDIMSWSATLPKNAQFRDWEITRLKEHIRWYGSFCDNKIRYFSCNSIGDSLTGCTQSKCSLTGGDWLPSRIITESDANMNIVKYIDSNDCLCKEGYEWIANKGCKII